MKTITILGGGNMGGAIASALKNDYDVTVIEPSGNYRVGGVKVLKHQPVISADYIILAIKPQLFADVLPELKFRGVIISIAAGIKIEVIKKLVGADKHIIRTMPNLPAQIKQGTTAICKDDLTTDDEFTEAVKIFETIGVVVPVAEASIDTVVALSGSSPAYAFMFVKAMAEFGEQNGIAFADSLKLASNALIGSLELAQSSDKSLDELIKMVCSPGGTTIAGVEYFAKHEFGDLIKQAMQAVKKRSQELGE